MFIPEWKMTQSCLSLNEELWQAEYLASDSESRWKLHRRRDQIYVAFLSSFFYYPLHPNPTYLPQFVAAARQFVQFGFSYRQQIVSCSVGSVPMIQSDAETVRFDCSKMFKVMSQCTFRSVSSNPADPQDFCNILHLDSRAGPKTSIVAPFLGVPPGSMWGGPEASVMQLLPLCVGTLLFHCEGSQWIRTSMQLRWIFLHLRYLSPIRLQFAHWFLMMQMMWMNVNECKWCKWMQMMQMNVKECKWLQTERAQQEDLYQSSPNLPVRSFLAPLHVMNHKGSQC